MEAATPEIRCPRCGNEFELSQALMQDIESTALKAAELRHRDEIEKLTSALRADAEAQLEIVKSKATAQAQQQLGTKIQELQEESAESKQAMADLRDQLLQTAHQLREATKAREDAALEMEAKLTLESRRIREEAEKTADERQRLNLAARDKTISDLQKSLEEAQRRASQGSQQLQGEILELDLESELMSAFREDEIEPVAKGVRGADIIQSVRTPAGTPCGVMLWEVKRTKNWVDSWIPKLKEDLRNEKANIAILVTEVMPKSISGEIGSVSGVWICKPKFSIILGTLLRKSLIDSGLKATFAEDRGTKADSLYNFVTSHEFAQQIEAMVETYQQMIAQLSKEKVQFTRVWAEREAQTERLLLSTARIIGNMQGRVGQTSMPRIKGLEILDAGADVVEE